jgi:hypothetical protein
MENTTPRLKFSFHNSKLLHLASHLHLNKNQVCCFDLPAGWTCPAADICKTRVSPVTGKMEKIGRFVCYAAKAECYAPSVRRLRWNNFELLKPLTLEQMTGMILEFIPNKVKIIRIHSSGDFFNPAYFDAWRSVAVRRPDILIFGYTKVLPYVLQYKADNFILQYSYGGLWDKRFDEMPIKPPACFVGETPGQYPGLPVVCGTIEKSHEDFDCILKKESFVIGMH